MKTPRLTLIALLTLLAGLLPVNMARGQSDTAGASAAPAAAPAAATASSDAAGSAISGTAATGQAGTQVGGMLGAAAKAAEGSTSAPGFGYDTFGGNAGAIIQGPIDEQYLLSPGDEIVVTIWGEMNEKFNLVVSDGGFLELPNEGGRVQANGVTLKELRPMLVNALSQIYAAYINAKEPLKSTANVDVRLGQIRPMLIYVVGEVEKAGAYAVSAAVANVVNLLHNAGGVRPTGSLREIRIRRSDGTIDTVDLYDFFLRGRIDYKKIRLQPGDYIIVPLKKKTVSLKGEVRRPVSYEMVGEEGLKEIMEFAGGPTPEAYLRQVQVRRSEVNQGERFLDVDLAALLADPKVDFDLQDGDVVTVGRNIQVRKNIVTIRGDGITRPGTYEWQPGMRLSDLIAKGEGLREYAFLERADLVRTESDFTKRLITFPLATLYAKGPDGQFAFSDNPAANFPLREMDEVLVQSAWGLAGEDKFVTLAGHVKNPGKHKLARNMTLYDMLFTLGGFQDPDFLKRTFVERAHVIRKVPGGVGEKIYAFDLGRVLSNDPTANMALEDADVIRIYSHDDLTMRREVTIDGLVKAPGTYALAEDLTLEDLVVLAGGLRPDAYKVEAVIARSEADGEKGGRPDRIYPTLVVPVPANFVQTPREQQTQLKAFDRVMIRNVLGWEPLDVVSVRGEVLLPGDYSLADRNETVSSLVKKAGGLRPEALPEGAMLLRKRNIVNTAPGASPETFEVTIQLAEALRTPGGPEDIVLKNGDRLFVPTNPGTVQVRGAVTRPLTVQHRTGQTLSQYIAQCGGYLEKADLDRQMVVAANNAVRLVPKGEDPVVAPGSTVDIPFQRDTERMRTIEVKGAVMKPAVVQFIDGAPMGYYINLCGGFAPNADPGRMVVHMPDGSMLGAKEGEPFNPALPAGSVVVVTTRPNTEAK